MNHAGCIQILLIYISYITGDEQHEQAQAGQLLVRQLRPLLRRRRVLQPQPREQSRPRLQNQGHGEDVSKLSCDKSLKDWQCWDFWAADFWDKVS